MLATLPMAMLLEKGESGFEPRSQTKAHTFNHYVKTGGQRISGHTEGLNFVEGADGGSDLGVENKFNEHWGELGLEVTLSLPLLVLKRTNHITYLSHSGCFNIILYA